MKLNKPLLTFLCLMLITQASYSQQKTESKKTSGNEYGIDLNRNYKGSEVLELLQIVEQEANLAIDSAFNEGYKQGMLAYAPEVEYWQTRAFQLQEEISKLKKDRWLYAVGGFGVGFLFGGGFGLTIRLQ